MATFTEKVCNPDLEKGQNQELREKKIQRLKKEYKEENAHDDGGRGGLMC